MFVNIRTKDLFPRKQKKNDNSQKKYGNSTNFTGLASLMYRTLLFIEYNI